MECSVVNTEFKNFKSNRNISYLNKQVHVQRDTFHFWFTGSAVLCSLKGLRSCHAVSSTLTLLCGFNVDAGKLWASKPGAPADGGAAGNLWYKNRLHFVLLTASVWRQLSFCVLSDPRFCWVFLMGVFMRTISQWTSCGQKKINNS